MMIFLWIVFNPSNSDIFQHSSCLYEKREINLDAGVDPGEATGAITLPKTYESNIFHHDFVQYRKTLHCQRRLDCQILLKSPPP